MNKLYAAMAIVVGLLSPFIAISVYQWGYEQGVPMGFSSVENEAEEPSGGLKGTDI